MPCYCLLWQRCRHAMWLLALAKVYICHVTSCFGSGIDTPCTCLFEKLAIIPCHLRISSLEFWGVSWFKSVYDSTYACLSEAHIFPMGSFVFGIKSVHDSAHACLSEAQLHPMGSFVSWFITISTTLCLFLSIAFLEAWIVFWCNVLYDSLSSLVDWAPSLRGRLCLDSLVSMTLCLCLSMTQRFPWRFDRSLIHSCLLPLLS